MMGMRQRGEVLPGNYMRDNRGWEAKLHGARGRRRLLLVAAGAAVTGLLLGAVVWRLWPTRTPLCLEEGQSCKAPDQCCTFNCLDGHCGSPAWNCKLMGQQCSHAYECCSYHCDEKAQCAPPPPPCLDHAQPCTKPAECCSGQCQEGKCHDPYHYECKQNAEMCEQDNECCGYLCRNGTCSDCGEDGTTCGRDEECCSYRCRNAVCQMCGQHGSQCSQDEDCCSMFCREGLCEYHEEYDKEYGNEWYTREEQERWEREEEQPETLPNPADDIDSSKLRDFIPSETYDGARHGMVWRTGPRGTGYYPAHVEDIVRTSKQIELEKQAELERQATLEKQAELERQAALEKQAELERQAEVEKKAELSMRSLLGQHPLSLHRMADQQQQQQQPPQQSAAPQLMTRHHPASAQQQHRPLGIFSPHPDHASPPLEPLAPPPAAAQDPRDTHHEASPPKPTFQEAAPPPQAADRSQGQDSGHGEPGTFPLGHPFARHPFVQLDRHPYMQQLHGEGSQAGSAVQGDSPLPQDVPGNPPSSPPTYPESDNPQPALTSNPAAGATPLHPLHVPHLEPPSRGQAELGQSGAGSHPGHNAWPTDTIQRLRISEDKQELAADS